MSYGLETYWSNGYKSFEMSDSLVQIVYTHYPPSNSSGSIVIPNVTSTSGMLILNITYGAVTSGHQGFNTWFSNNNTLNWSARPYGGLVQPSNAKLLVISTNV